MELTKPVIKKMLRAVEQACPEDINCEKCFEKLDIFAEKVLDGQNVEQAMPLVKNHLDRCHECQELFEALLEILDETTNKHA